jgi:hypothetical protein
MSTFIVAAPARVPRNAMENAKRENLLVESVIKTSHLNHTYYKISWENRILYDQNRIRFDKMTTMKVS